jgi:hypothetical protein
MIPPWVAFPEYGPEEPFWRQAGEKYLNAFLEDWGRLGEEEKMQFLVAHHAPKEWHEHLRPGGFLDWLKNLED